VLNRISILTLIVLGIFALATPATASTQTTWYVDDDAPNDPGPGNPNVSDPLEDGSAEHPFDAIQEAVFACQNGDTVLVADGTYTGPLNKDIDFGGLGITVRSEDGPHNCVVDCEGEGRGFQFRFGEGPDSVLDGLTVTSGFGTYPGGGAVLCSDSSPTLINCIVASNTTQYNGGGILCEGDSDPLLCHCVLHCNSGSYSGGGFYSYGSGTAPILVDCVISGNTTGGSGAGVRCGGSTTIVGCIIIGNSSFMNRGGIYAAGGTLIMTGTVVVGNATEYTNAGGGGVYHNVCSMEMSNCTIVGNTSAWRGGGVYCEHSDGVLASSVLWNNHAPEGPEIAVMGASVFSLSYSDVEGGWAWIHVGSDCTLDWADGNIVADPLFVDADGPDDDPNTWQDNDYHLSPGSACIDAADNTAVPPDTLDLDDDADTDERTPFDLDARLRFADRIAAPDTGNPDPNFPDLPIVDMGAYEYQCTGDLDGSGQIDLADLAQLLGSYGETAGVTYYDGDLDADGDVDLADLAELLGRYGTECP